MAVAYKTVYEGSTAEIVEKKSRFIATVFAVSDEETALEHIEEMRKKYWDAKHNCYAYVIGTKAEIQRFSDDGEPSQTAGKPMLDVLLGEEVRNVLVVVTRYFGGTLLGTGGLVRAYSKATKDGLSNSSIIEKTYGTRLLIKTDYNGIGKIKYIIGQMDIYSENSDYTDVVSETVIVSEDLLEAFKKKVIEVTSGKAEINEVGKNYFAILEGKVIED